MLIRSLVVAAVAMAAACDPEPGVTRAEAERKPRPIRGGSTAAVPIADGFDFPVGAPDGVGYYDAQAFGLNQHLGEDWNGKNGGDSDLGDPVYAIADGRVTFADDVAGGWGNVVRITHRVIDRQGARVVESLYAHLDTMSVDEHATVRRGDRIGTIGTAHGRYLAHLHLELRDRVGLPLGGGYGVPEGQIAPSAFIRAHRPRHRRVRPPRPTSRAISP